jgi:NTP pyrophosphatase (non-canonical NTP hydrolase)
MMLDSIAKGVRALQEMAYQHTEAKGFLKDDARLEELGFTHLIHGTRLALIMGEAAEALQELREPTVDRDKVMEELADIMIRTAQFAESYGGDLGAAVRDKLLKNMKRPPLHGKVF